MSPSQSTTSIDAQSLTQSGLSKALEKLGRTRGSSATPVPAILSPTPNRNLQKQLDDISSTIARYGSSDGDGTATPPSESRSMSSAAVQVGQGQKRALSTTTNGKSHRYAFKNGSHEDSSTPEFCFPAEPGQAPLHHSSTSHLTFSQLASLYRSHLSGIEKSVAGTPGVPPDLKDKIVNQLNGMAQEFDEKQHLMQMDYNSLRDNLDYLQSQLASANGKLKAAIKDRNRYETERDELRAHITVLRLKSQTSEEKLNNHDKKWRKINQDLIRKIGVQEEQLRGRRALWLESNPGSNARRDIMTSIRDPFDSPSTQTHYHGKGTKVYRGKKPNFSSSFHNSLTDVMTDGMSNGITDSMLGGINPSFSDMSVSPLISAVASFQKSSTTQTDDSDPHPLRRRGNLPYGRPLPVASPVPKYTDNNIKMEGEAGLERRDKTSSTALVLRSSDAEWESLEKMYRAKFHNLFEIIEVWTKMYTSVPDLANDQVIARTNEGLWAYMMNCAYPGHRQDSHTHIMTLLQDVKTRSWFVQRMATTYCVKDIMTLESFHSYSPRVKASLLECDKKLANRGLANEERQNIINEQAEAIKSVIDSPDYPTFRSNRLNYHTRRLRDMLGQLLNSYCSRADAGRDLGAVAVYAWDTSVEMLTSSLTFKIYFPETSGKYNAATMVAKDKCFHDPIQLQINQVRLKLVITPVVVMRDDRTTTIRARDLHPATVLVME